MNENFETIEVSKITPNSRLPLKISPVICVNGHQESLMTCHVSSKADNILQGANKMFTSHHARYRQKYRVTGKMR